MKHLFLIFNLFYSSMLLASNDIGNLMKASEQGDPFSQFMLGMHYSHNNEADKSLHWLNEAAKQDHPASIHMLASFYLTGKHVTKSNEKALELYERHALLGFRDTQLFIAKLKAKPEIQKTDYVTSLAWILLANAFKPLEAEEIAWYSQIHNTLSHEQRAQAQIKAKALSKRFSLTNSSSGTTKQQVAP